MIFKKLHPPSKWKLARHLALQTAMALLQSALALLLAAFASASIARAQVAAGARSGDNTQIRRLCMMCSGADGAPVDDPATLSFNVSGAIEPRADRGLWLSGDRATATAHLRWIAGKKSPGLIELDGNGRVSVNARELAAALGIHGGIDSMNLQQIASLVAFDEGLLLLAQVTGGPYRYLLHVGETAPTLGGEVKVTSALNLDNRYDNRINPRRRGGQKLKVERPPEGFDVLIAINPSVGWFNLHDRQVMPAAQVIFHELAESQARLVLGLDYLSSGDDRGAHQVAIDRETILERQRGGRSVVKPIGSNIVLASHNDWLRLFDWLLNPKGAESPLEY